MSTLTRFGVSLDTSLLEKFDRLCQSQGYENRSEAIRDLIRNYLVRQEWAEQQKQVAGCLVLVYDHHSSNLSQKLTSIQHEFHSLIISSMHVHLDHDNCLETLVLKGNADAIRQLSQLLIATKGVKYGKLNIATTGQNIV